MNIERLIHSIKTVIACLLGFFLTKIVGFPADQWIVITIIVVMCAQIYVGSVMQKAYWRFLGTTIGCLFAATTLVFFGESNLAIATTIGLSSFTFSYLATERESFTYAGTLGAVTTAIIMLGQHPTLLFALERFLEISVGILIATLVSQFVLPIHARTHLRRSQATTLGQLRDYYIESMIKYVPGSMPINYQDLDEAIVVSLLKQRQLAKESRRERLGVAFDPAHFMRSLYCEREILRAMTFMQHAKTQMSEQRDFLQSPALQSFNTQVVACLNALMGSIGQEKQAGRGLNVPDLGGLRSELQGKAGEKDGIYVEGFIFCAEILVKSLGALAGLYGMGVMH